MKFIYLIFIFHLVGCQSLINKTDSQNLKKENSSLELQKKIVVLDTRSSLDYELFHIEGSLHLPPERFLVLTNPKTKKYKLESDLKKIIQTLSEKGISPQMTVVLLGIEEQSLANKKMKWLLTSLEVKFVELKEVKSFYKSLKPPKRINPVDSNEPWELSFSEDYQKSMILDRAQECFVKITTQARYKCE